MNSTTETMLINESLAAILAVTHKMQQVEWDRAARTVSFLERKLRELRTGVSAGFW